MDELRLTYDQTLESLTKAAEANPGRISRTAAADLCTYFYENNDDNDLTNINKIRQENGLDPVTEGMPNCIVGHVMADHGVVLDDLKEVKDDVWDSKGNSGMNVEDLVRNQWLHVDERTKTLLQITQTSQDRNKPWLEALEDGLARVRQYDAEQASQAS